jgi:hypothetical protein
MAGGWVGFVRGLSSLVLCVSLVGAPGAIGCISNNETPTTAHRDASAAEDAALPPFDSGGSVTPTNDASSPSDDAGPPVDGGSPTSPPDAALPNGSQVGLVGGGTVSTSAHYTLVGSAGPARAPVLTSANYQLTGGLTASSR